MTSLKRKYCFVKSCNNNTIKFPEKNFFTVPSGNKAAWCDAAGLDNVPSRGLFICEDHLNVEEDLENYMYWKTMNARARLKPRVPTHLKIENADADDTSADVTETECSSEIDMADKKSSLVPTLIKIEVHEETQFSENSSPLPENSDASADITETECSSKIDIADKNSSLVPTMIKIEVHEETQFSENSSPLPENSDTSAHITETECSSKIDIADKNSSLVPTMIKIEVHEETQFSENSSPLPENSDTSAHITETECSSKIDIADKKSSFFPILIKSEFHEETQFSENSSPLPEISDKSADVTDMNGSSKIDTAKKKTSLIGRKFMMNLVEEKPMTYIGIPKKCYWIVGFLAQEIKSVSNLDIIVTLYKIRRNETFGKIADLFQLSMTTLRRTYYQTLAVLSIFFKQFIYWPPAFVIKRNLPNTFRNHKEFSKVQSIIECFETETEKSSNFVQQPLSWSQYKSCNTAKYLISATPNGFINYVSTGYGGCASDVSIVEKCGFMQIIPENCNILADRGFKNLETILNRNGTKLVRPSSVFNKTTQPKNEDFETKVIADLRMHIERVFRRVHMYKILKPHAIVNKKLIKTLDDVVIVACGLINLQSSIIKRD